MTKNNTTSSHQRLLSKQGKLVKTDSIDREVIVSMVNGLKTNEYKTKTYGDWVAESWEDKQLVNAVLQDLLTKLTK